jgi:deoxyadenosine/deoxycytidine kinase
MTDIVKLFERIKKSKKRLVSIEGCIGVGKTTLGNDIVEMLNTFNILAKFYPEPFNQKMLQQFINNPKEYAYAFQMYMLTRRQLDYNEAYREKDTTLSILDRSLTGDYTFMSLQRESENVTEGDFKIYSEEYAKFTKYEPDAVVYLNVDLDTMKRRIVKRAREGEDKYDFDYLNKLGKKYMEILPEHIPNEKLIIVNWGDDVMENGHIKQDVIIGLLEQIFTS